MEAMSRNTPRWTRPTTPLRRQNAGVSVHRKAGLGLALAAIGCWLVVVLAMVTADGSPVGPALIAGVGFALTIVALLVLLQTLPSTGQGTTLTRGAPKSEMKRRLAIVLATLAIILLVLAVGIGDAVSGSTARSLLLAGVVAFIGASTLIATLPSRRG